MKRTKTISAGSWFEAREKAKRTFRNFALDYARKQGIQSSAGASTRSTSRTASPDMKRSYGIQVKGNHWEGTQSFWLTGKRAKTDSGPGLFSVFVNLKRDGARPDFYLVPSKVVTKRMWEERRKESEWYGFDRDEEFKEEWDRLE